MTEDSGFFSEPDRMAPETGIMELIHSSGSGWSEIYRISINGQFKVLKVLKKEYRGRTLYESILRKEYDISSRLKHQNIREVFDYYRHPELGSAIEMEWINGCTLSELTAGGRLDRKLAMRLSDQLCDAVSYLHSHQIVHRDIKPDNILVTFNGKNLKLIDFGLSDADSWVTLKGSCGTPAFAAPETLKGQASGCSSDIWSLGKVTGILLSGKRRQIHKCTAYDPGQRYADASQFKADLHKKSQWGTILALIMVLAIGTAGFICFKKPVPTIKEEEQNKPIDNPAIIDELFRQATQMIESQE